MRIFGGIVLIVLGVLMFRSVCLGRDLRGGYLSGAQRANMFVFSLMFIGFALVCFGFGG